MTAATRTYLVRVHEVRSYEVEAESEAQARAMFDEHAQDADLPIGALTSVTRPRVEIVRLDDVAQDAATTNPSEASDPSLSVQRLL